MKKKNLMMRIAGGVMMAALLSTCAISGTFAKYTTSSTVTATATVAKWDIELNDKDITSTEITFDLFNTVCDLDADGNVTAGTQDSDVTTGKLIAPGTGGMFAFKITNSSEVTAKYEIDFSATLNSVPLEFSADNSNWETSIDGLDILNDNAKTVNIDKSDDSVKIYWRWKFEDNRDTDDTTLGTAETPAQVTVTAKITATQVD